MKRNVTKSFRFSEDTVIKLQKIAEAEQRTVTSWIAIVVDREYKKVFENHHPQ